MMGESLPKKKIQNSLNPIDNILDDRKLLRKKNPNFLDSESVNFPRRVENLRKNKNFSNSRKKKLRDKSKDP